MSFWSWRPAEMWVIYSISNCLSTSIYFKIMETISYFSGAFLLNSTFCYTLLKRPPRKRRSLACLRNLLEVAKNNENVTALFWQIPQFPARTPWQACPIYFIWIISCRWTHQLDSRWSVLAGHLQQTEPFQVCCSTRTSAKRRCLSTRSTHNPHHCTWFFATHTHTPWHGAYTTVWLCMIIKSSEQDSTWNCDLHIVVFILSVSASPSVSDRGHGYQL